MMALATVALVGVALVGLSGGLVGWTAYTRRQERLAEDARIARYEADCEAEMDGKHTLGSEQW